MHGGSGVVPIRAVDSCMGRAAFLAQRQCFDVLVAGWGSTGFVVAPDAALRGLSVPLPYPGDIAPGTLSGSSRMIHSGLRYLMRGRLGPVRECLSERTMPCRLAPHLARRASFVIALSRPVARGVAGGIRVPMRIQEGFAVREPRFHVALPHLQASSAPLAQVERQGAVLGNAR